MRRIQPHLLILLLLLAPQPSQAQENPRKHALVIGNSDYPAAQLTAATQNAEAIATQLKTLGFTVDLGLNLDRAQLLSAIAAFRDRTAHGEVGLFYYNGYAIQARGRNYLIPLDANIRVEPDVDLESVSFDLLLTGLGKNPAQTHVIILDAPHASPYELAFRPGGGAGLAFVTAPNGAFIAYAQAPGATLPPDTDSLYTPTLLQHIDTPGVPIGATFRTIRDAVRKASRGAQNPWESHRLNAPFTFAKADVTGVSASIILAKRPLPIQRNQNGQRNTVPSDWVLISPGAFTMGSPPSETSRSQKENPYRVTLTRAFLMQKTEVTQAQWIRVMGSNPSQFTGCDDCPVERVSFYDALHFANAMSTRDGLEACYTMLSCTGTPGGGCPSTGCTGDFTCGTATFKGLTCTGYRLPTEAEWEYAARAGNEGTHYGALGDAAWYANNAGGSTHPVARKQPNAWGLYDTLGNVWEWVWGWHSPYPTRAAIDPIGNPSTASRVNRGGGWRNHSRHVRFAMRHPFSGKDRYNSFGLRLVRTWSP